MRSSCTRTAARTKTESIVSKHVYIARHFSGPYRVVFHAVVVTKNLIDLFVFGLLDLLTLRGTPQLNVRSRMLRMLLGRYAGSLRSGAWLRNPRLP